MICTEIMAYFKPKKLHGSDNHAAHGSRGWNHQFIRGHGSQLGTG